MLRVSASKTDGRVKSGCIEKRTDDVCHLDGRIRIYTCRYASYLAAQGIAMQDNGKFSYLELLLPQLGTAILEHAFTDKNSLVTFVSAYLPIKTPVIRHVAELFATLLQIVLSPCCQSVNLRAMTHSH